MVEINKRGYSEIWKKTVSSKRQTFPPYPSYSRYSSMLWKTTFYLKVKWLWGIRKSGITKYSRSKTSKNSNYLRTNVPWRQTHQLEICTSSFGRNTVGIPMGQEPLWPPDHTQSHGWSIPHVTGSVRGSRSCGFIKFRAALMFKI